MDYCTQNNIAFIPYGSLGAHPLKRGAPLANAEGILADIAQKKGVKPNQIALAWLLHYAPNIVLIPGTTTIAHLEENIAVNSIHLTTDEVNLLNRIENFDWNLLLCCSLWLKFTRSSIWLKSVHPWVCISSLLGVSQLKLNQFICRKGIPHSNNR